MTNSFIYLCALLITIFFPTEMTHKRFVVFFAYGTALRWMKELERDFMIFFYKKTLPQNDKTSNVQPLMNFAKKKCFWEVRITISGDIVLVLLKNKHCVFGHPNDQFRILTWEFLDAMVLKSIVIANFK